MAATLRERYNFAVTVLLDATREQLFVALEHLRTVLTEDDNLLIYYTGYGLWDTAAERVYWLAVDAEPGTRSHWLSTLEITDVLKAMPARHVLLVTDAGFPGTLVSDASTGHHPRLRPEMPWPRATQPRARTALTAGSMEPVLDRREGHPAVFCHAFLTALEENRGMVDGSRAVAPDHTAARGAGAPAPSVYESARCRT